LPHAGAGLFVQHGQDLARLDTCRLGSSAQRRHAQRPAGDQQDYKDACDLIVSRFRKGRRVDDLDREDFAELQKKMAVHWGPATLGNVINRRRVAFKFAHDNGLIDRSVRYGQGFQRPSRKTLRIDQAKKGPLTPIS
jgi:hypothetical protein